MKTMRLKPALQYRIPDLLKGAGIFYGIMVLVLLVIYTLLTITVGRDSNSTGSFSGYGMASTISTFIFGLCMIRSDLRLLLQNGASRRTAYAATLCAAVVVALLLAVAGELLSTAAQVLLAGQSSFRVTDIYWLTFAPEGPGSASLLQHIESIACYFGLFLSAFLCGGFLSMLYYRLNTFWTWLVSIAVPVLLFAGGPLLAIRLAQFPFFVDFVNFIGSMLMGSPWTFCLLFLFIGAVFAAVTWLLLRRAPVKAAKR